MWLNPIRSPFGIFAFLLFFSSIAVDVSAQDCSASNPCATGCCSKYVKQQSLFISRALLTVTRYSDTDTAELGQITV